MAYYRKASNEPSSDRGGQGQHFARLKGLFAKTVGQIKQEKQLLSYNSKDYKQENVSKELQSANDGKNVQGILLKQLGNFHDHYGNKIQQLRSQIQILKQIIKALEQQVQEKNQTLSQSETQLEIALREKQELLKMIQISKQKQQGRNDKSDIHSFYESLSSSYKDKLFALESKHKQQISSVSLKIIQLSKQKEQIQRNMQKIMSENSQMKLRIREYQIQKKYQNQRIKNATIELSLKIKNQEEIISRMTKQQSKQLYARSGSCRLSDIGKKDTMNDSAGGGILTSDPNYQSVLSGSILDQLKVTSKKIPNIGQWNSRELPMFVSEKERQKLRQKGDINDIEKEKKPKVKQSMDSSQTHKRNLSYHQRGDTSPRQQQKLLTARDTKSKGSNDLKIKVMRLDKMRKK